MALPTILEELQKLSKKIKGSDSKATNTAEALAEIVTAYSDEIVTNLLQPYGGEATTNTSQGVTEVNENGIYTFSGTPDQSDINIGNIAFKNDIKRIISDAAATGSKLKLVGVARGETRLRLTIGLYDSKYQAHFYVDEGNGVEITPIEGCTLVMFSVRVVGTPTLDNVVVKPMLTTSMEATIDNYVPYTGGTGTLQGDVAALLARVEALEAK